MPGSIIAASVFGLTAGTFAFAATAFAINMVASSIISKAFAPKGYGSTDETPNPGNNQQLPPAGDNKLPVVYGTAFVGGIVTDLSISADNQNIYYVLALAEVTNTETGGTPDTITFGNVYWGGKRCVFDGTDTTSVVGLLDESTGITDTTVAGKINIYLYKNGSNNGANTTQSAIQVMSQPGLTYTWDANKLMTNCAFAIVHLKYSASANVTGLQQTRFQITNSRHKPGECMLDYWTSTRYGAAIPLSQIDTATLTALDVYSDEVITYQPYSGGYSTQTRFRFDGLLDTNSTIMTNMQAMASCCDCLLRYNEIIGKWGVIVQSPAYTVAMDINDTNMVSAIQVTPIDLASSYNVAEVKFPDGSAKDAFSSAVFDLAVVNPALLYPNEPVNKQTISLPLVNNNVRAQYIANRFLEEAREDLQVKVSVNYVGLQLEAGDVVTLTNANYGWAAKLFRISQVVERFGSDGSITAALSLMEFNPAVFDDANVVQFTPAPNTGIGSPLGFGTVPAPAITSVQTTAPVPSFDVSVVAASAGISQYAEVYYSAYASPLDEQRIFAGTTAVNPGGNPYTPGASMGALTLTNIPQGDWYFASRMVNSLGKSNFSGPSTKFSWRPMTFQYSKRWIAVAYATNSTGTAGFSLDPRGKTYFGLLNSDTANGSSDPADYIWYPGTFGTDNYLLMATRGDRRASFAIGNAGYSNLGGAFVPTATATYDTSVWGALEDGTNYIDLDARTGQLTKAGTTAVSSADGLLSVNNNTNGSMVVSLEKFLNFGNGVYSKTFNAATLTIDVYGRVVGFSEPDNFYFTNTVFTATAGQTVFSFSRTGGDILVFRDGVLQDLASYTATLSTVTLSPACAAGETVIIIGMRAVSVSVYYEDVGLQIVSAGTNTVVYDTLPFQPINAGDQLCFAASQPNPLDSVTLYTVQSVNTSTKTITFTGSISGATAGYGIFRYRAAGSEYTPFTRYEVNLSAANTYSPTQFTIRNGFEFLFCNGVQINEVDYDLSGNVIGGFPGPMTGRFVMIMFTENNFGVPASNVTNNVAYSINGALSYVFPNNPLSVEIFANGALLAQGVDYTANTAGYNLTTAYPNNFTLLNQQTYARMGAA